MHKLKQIKLKPWLEAFYTIWPGNGLGLHVFYRSSGWNWTAWFPVLNFKQSAHQVEVQTQVCTCIN